MEDRGAFISIVICPYCTLGGGLSLCSVTRTVVVFMVVVVRVTVDVTSRLLVGVRMLRDRSE